MERERSVPRSIDAKDLASVLGDEVLARLALIRRAVPAVVYLTGGTVRDILLGRDFVDIDLTVERQARQWAAELSRVTGGTYVPLGRDEDAARVVWQGVDIDFSSFREGAETIEQELTKRDITINSLALPLEMLFAGKETVSAGIEVIDPLGGLRDLEQGVIRMNGREAFASDPLRLLRIYRFAAVLDFSIEQETEKEVAARKEWIGRSAPERVGHELDLIMATPRAPQSVARLAATGLLFEVIPELRSGVGMEQPDSHHLDVFDHSLATLQGLQSIIDRPAAYFPGQAGTMEKYLFGAVRRMRLRWAALLHDLGKPAAMTIDEDRGGRITFYNHDIEGGRQVGEIGRRLRWSGEMIHEVGALVASHMRPFHLGNVRRRGELSLKACLRLVRTAGPLLPGLFLLAMADAAAGKGEGRPEAIELEVAELFDRLERVRCEYVEPVRCLPPLLNGRDLIGELGLVPGPDFRKILALVEEAHMERRIRTRPEALELVRRYLAGEECPGKADREE